MEELDRLVNDGCELIVPGGKENTYGKVNILLQSYVSRVSVDSFSLISDMAYVAQVSLWWLEVHCHFCLSLSLSFFSLSLSRRSDFN